MKFLFHVLVLFLLLESSGGIVETPNAFIFFLDNFEGLATFVSEAKTGNTIFRGSNYGPMFGSDLVIFSNNPTSASQSFTDFGNSYSVPASVKANLENVGWHQRAFSPDEVEVFYLDPSR